MANFDNRVALVTGGSSGIGLAMARALLAAGARRVYVTGRDEDRLAAAVRDLGERAVGLRADVASVPDLERLGRQIGEGGDGIDALFANAGIAANNALGATTEAEFDAMFAINVRGVYFTVQTLLPLLKDGASIVLTSSIAGIKGMPNLSAYSASKAAVRSLARCWAVDLAPRKIRVNTLSPGVTDTPILSGGLRMDPAALEGLHGYLRAAAPSGRMGRADEIANAALFLASDAAGYMNGAELCIDGGLAQV